MSIVFFIVYRKFIYRALFYVAKVNSPFDEAKKEISQIRILFVKIA